MVLVRVWIWLSIWLVADGKIYRRCDLVKELRNFDVPEEEIGTWVCIARHESNYDTEAMNPGSGDHGLFQISQLYWCSPPGDGYGCNSPCEKFRDDDIGDDLQCVRRIFREHKRISGNGFNAWVVYPLYCAQNTTQYVQDCSQEPSGPAKPTNGTDNEISVEEEGDGYHFPALPSLAKEPLQKDRAEKQLPFSKVSIHYSIPVNKGVFRQLPFNKHSIHHFIPLIGGSDQSNPTNEPSESTTSMKENDDSPVTMTELLELEPTTTKRRFSTSTKNRSSEPLLASSSIPLGSIARKAKNESSPTTPLLAFRSSAAQTTETPEGRQVTFAPGSFFSWIFNSQTLPPILPPARPPRPQGGPARPPTMRPGGGRPGQGPGPNRPDGLLTTRRPLPIRPSPMGHPHRRRPGGIKSNSPSAERARKFVKLDGAVEVALDDNFVFVRTMYGYRLLKVQR